MVNQIYYCDVIEHDGKRYVNITSVCTKVKLEYYSFKIEGDTIVANTINRIVNANWKKLHIEMESHINEVVGEIMQTILMPICNRISF